MDDVSLFRRTRGLTAVAVGLLALQLFGNLYEEVVTNPAVIADPLPGRSVDELAPGSPLYYYMPWVAVGVAVVVALFVRVRRSGQSGSDLMMALGGVVVTAAAKVVLITSVNPTFRDPLVAPNDLRATAIVWGIGNGVAILAVGFAIAMILRWRARLADEILEIAAVANTGKPRMLQPT